MPLKLAAGIEKRDKYFIVAMQADSYGNVWLSAAPELTVDPLQPGGNWTPLKIAANLPNFQTMFDMAKLAFQQELKVIWYGDGSGNVQPETLAWLQVFDAHLKK